ncbi:MAG TPA: GNAT family N-acetyltransferase [Rhodoblastus sp.]|nr:GNAT family N-acetyltransferase [Rhodoblastus sp.]
MNENCSLRKAPRLVVVEQGESAPALEIAARLAAHVAADFGPRDETPLSIFAYDGEELVAGLNGVTHWRWLYVRNLWTARERRGQGLGAALLAAAENKARARGCIGVYIDTFDPKAAAFYEKRGFARFGVIADFPPGARRIFLSKRIDG